MKPGINKEKLKTVGLIILAIIIIGYGIFNLYKWNDKRVRLDAFNNTVESLILEMKSNCQPLSLKSSSEVKIINIDDNCLEARQAGQPIPIVIEPEVEIIELEEEEG